MIIPFPKEQFSKNPLPTTRQSNIITKAIYDFNVYEKRIFYNIVKYAQEEIADIIHIQNCGTITTTDNDIQLSIRIKDCLLGNDDKNHTRIKQGLATLSQKEIKFKINDEYRTYPILHNHRFDEDTFSLIFDVDKHVWNAIKEPSFGYTEYDLNESFHFQSVYSMRMYELISLLRTPSIISIDDIREMLNILNKYDRTKDLIQKVIDSAQKELDEKSSKTFVYKKITIGNKINSLKFYVVRNDRVLSKR